MLYLKTQLVMHTYRLSVVAIFLIVFSLSAMAQYTDSKPIMNKKTLKEFVKIHIDYPENEYQNKTQGTVEISSTIDEFGNVTDYQVTKSISPGLDSAAISIFRLILWNPATSLGKPVPSKSEFEIKYNIKSYNKLAQRRGYKHITPPTISIDTSMIIYGVKQLDTVPTAILEPGIRTISDLIYSKLTYPEAAIKLGLSGEVKLLFVVETNGLPSNIIAEKHLGAGCTEEAMKIVETIRWVPGIKNNKAIRTRYRLSVNFKNADNRDGHIPNQSGSGI